MFVAIKNFFTALLALIVGAAPFGGQMPEERKCNPEFNGTFLQSWASSTWDEARWAEEVDNMLDDGIEYLILQDIANMDADGNWTVYYDESLPAFDSAVNGGDVIGAALEACKGSGIKVFIGLALCDSFWTVGNFLGDYDMTCDVAADMVRDIHSKYYEDYPTEFYGWYFTPEINNMINCSPLMGKMAKGINKVIDAINETEASLPLLISPFTSDYLSFGKVAAYAGWLTFFEKVNWRDGDIIAPQDAVGAKWTDESELVRIWKTYSEAVSRIDADVKLWANVENFEIAIGPSPLGGIILRKETENIESVTATLDRFTKRMEIASRYCENIITFSYSHYYSKSMVKPFYIETYHDYVNNGYVLEKQAPTAPANISKTIDENGVTVSWQESTDNFGIAYYRVTKNGEFFTRIENYKWDYPLEITDPQGTESDIYAVVACDAAGNFSAWAEV